MKETSGNGYVPIIAQAIEEMKAAQGDSFSLEQINLAELERRTGISRGKLRRLKKNGFRDSRYKYFRTHQTSTADQYSYQTVYNSGNDRIGYSITNLCHILSCQYNPPCNVLYESYDCINEYHTIRNEYL